MGHMNLTFIPGSIVNMHLCCLKTLARCYYAGTTNHCLRPWGSHCKMASMLLCMRTGTPGGASAVLAMSRVWATPF